MIKIEMVDMAIGAAGRRRQEQEQTRHSQIHYAIPPILRSPLNDREEPPQGQTYHTGDRGYSALTGADGSPRIGSIA